MKFNTRGAEALVNGKPSRQPNRLNVGQGTALAQKIGEGPIAAADEVVRWHQIDLCQWVWEAFRVSISVQTMSREMRALGYRSCRPRQSNLKLPKDGGAAHL